jgi:hypothetical protein
MPPDLKLLVKTVLTDPTGLNMPTLPSSAIVHGIAKGATGNRTGVYGFSERSVGIYGESPVFAGFFAGDVHVVGNFTLDSGNTHLSLAADSGLASRCETGSGVVGETNSLVVAAIAGINHSREGTGAGIYGRKFGTKGHAGFFEGNVHVTGNLSTDGDIALQNADCAEDFTIASSDLVEPGTVMIVDEDETLSPSIEEYDKRVAGVISGAGRYKPGLVLDRRGSSLLRQPLALLGKVYCKVDATFGAIEVGDLLTTSRCPGHAMKASDASRAFGAVIGKSLRRLDSGRGLVPILIALQ